MRGTFFGPKIMKAVDEAGGLVKKQPGFTTPYSTTKDFLESLAAPVIVPVAFSVVTMAAAGITALSTAAGVAALVVGSISGLCGAKSFSNASFEFAAKAALTAAVAALAAMVSALATVVIAVIAPVKLVTRSVATLVDQIAKLFSSSVPNTDVYGAYDAPYEASSNPKESYDSANKDSYESYDEESYQPAMGR